MLYQNHQDNISKPIESQIIAMCSDIQKNNPILDSRTLDYMVQALSLTEDWRKCLEYMKVHVPGNVLCQLIVKTVAGN